MFKYFVLIDIKCKSTLNMRVIALNKRKLTRDNLQGNLSKFEAPMKSINKKIITIIFLLITGLSTVLAQDLITLKNNEEMKARIIRLNQKDVIFIPLNSVDTAYLLREDVKKLQYHNGITIILEETKKPEKFFDLGNDSLYLKGKEDATRCYKAYTGAFVGTLITSIFIPWGLIPAISCSATPPKTQNLGYESQQLIENPSYYNGYKTQAHKIKKKKVWGGFAIGSGITIGLIILTSALAI